jgi:hypothetical protein
MSTTRSDAVKPMKTSASARVIYPLADGRAILYHSAKKNKPMKTDKDHARLRIEHYPDNRWYVAYTFKRQVTSTEYIFDTFEEVSRWVENRYWELEAAAKEVQA